MYRASRWLSLGWALPLIACSGERAPVTAQETWTTDFSKSTVPMSEIVSGGPPKDGIPAIDDPVFIPVDRADRWLGDREPVAVVRNGTVVKAYPLQILIWHEIVNDRVGDLPVSVTFCPLCNTTLAFDRRFDGRLLDFGTTGRLRHSDLVMYDRQTETWWQQATGEGIVGEYAGEQLTFVPANVMAWSDVKSQFPEAQVLSRETGHQRRYGENPYRNYDRRQNPFSWAWKGRQDDRLPLMERVVAIGGVESESVAVPFSTLAEERVVELDHEGEPLVVFWAPGTASALEATDMARGRDVGASAVFRSELDGDRLRFEEAGDGRFRDRETGSVWSLAGVAVDGPHAGRSLEAVPHGNHFWFAWITFRPETRVER